MKEKECGDCDHFDPLNTDREPLGSVVINGETVVQGVCRINKGLTLGILHGETDCKQPSGHFLSRAPVSTSPSLANAI